MSTVIAGAGDRTDVLESERARLAVHAPDRLAVSVVIPCLNEAQSIGACVSKARLAIANAHLRGEVIVVDNGSTDGSAEIAEAAGACVVREERRGYGSAYLAGFAASRGEFLLMGDGDGTYDFLDLPRFLEPLQSGRADIVIGSRLTGEIRPGAMSWSHRWIGNPILSGMLRLMFRTSVSDSHCGMRAFTRAAYDRMNLQAVGMEFASEMVVCALRQKLRIAEIPITYYPREGESKLDGVRDAWRHVRFMLMYSPSHLFLLPGVMLMLSGGVVMALLMPGPLTAFGRTWDYHPLMFAAGALILGYDLVLFDVFAKSYAMAAGFARPDEWLKRLSRWFSLERGVLLGMCLLAAGAAIELRIVYGWVESDYGRLMAIRQVAAGVALVVIGAQTVFASFMVSLMQIRRQ